MSTHGPKICISGISLLREAISKFQPDLVISIADPHSDVAKEADRLLDETGVTSVRVRFHDNAYGQPNAELATFEDLEEVGRALDREVPQDDPRVLVHCHAGSQRSPAMAIFALGHIANRSDSLDDARARQIVDEVFVAAPHAEPNDRVLAIGSDLLDVPGWFHGAMQDRRREIEKKRERITGRTGSKFAGKKRKRAFRV